MRLPGTLERVIPGMDLHVRKSAETPGSFASVASRALLQLYTITFVKPDEPLEEDVMAIKVGDNLPEQL